ncbi:Multimeric flavodoxin WrbA [Methanosarcina thermophila]|jgi:multimeric flavodoxin WrbA|uniref:Iron-sulfur flavoprotein n=3 Tax=Methanosarcina thermophila TaxID=2210 RepID=A0A1I6X1B2_METTE|nr:NAD(P)H-dependent oxidoreductase [Methanosarcina thermophila]ALK04809.1 MAG: NADPH-dependent FMN reductase [Methanosarcina sp. 795]AKB13521.1 iron-sulfur flavoprotein [Methanosarcina thermophila TM-1]AKB15846.1 iron-sulfur flavoprotein [Methanosarcina thermophila CHTI-55]NLU56596.1 NAD(P)H-dependent oxidoreductase [Methanosarcina thermophila]SFT32065.1 Multimeric flavodoxin WrbA [Methanosarcina thermophila]
MRILVIMGSPRKSNTYRAARKIEEYMQSMDNVEFEYLMLKDANLLQCRGCYVCLAKGEEYCPCKDEAPLIEQKMHAADGVIFASPVYGMNISALMKTFVDRFSYIFHRPRFLDKKALLLSTTGAVGLKEVLDYLKLVAGIWGFEVSQSIGLITPPGMISKKQEQENNRKLEKAALEYYNSFQKKRRSPGLKDVLIFRAQKASFGKPGYTGSADYAYWKEKGWLNPEAKYYVDVPVNPVYNAIGWISEQMIRRKMEKEIAELRE